MTWENFFLDIFHKKLALLKLEIDRIKLKNPKKLKGHPKLKLYLGILKALDVISQDPTLKIYELGNTLGEENRDWRRIKKHGLPDRYRLFFKFFSQYHQIFYAWFNDERTLRTEGARNDCYNIFLKYITSGKIPSTYEELTSKSVETNNKQNNI